MGISSIWCLDAGSPSAVKPEHSRCDDHRSYTAVHSRIRIESAPSDGVRIKVALSIFRMPTHDPKLQANPEADPGPAAPSRKASRSGDRRCCRTHQGCHHTLWLDGRAARIRKRAGQGQVTDAACPRRVEVDELGEVLRWPRQRVARSWSSTPLASRCDRRGQKSRRIRHGAPVFDDLKAGSKACSETESKELLQRPERQHVERHGPQATLAEGSAVCRRILGPIRFVALAPFEDSPAVEGAGYAVMSTGSSSTSRKHSNAALMRPRSSASNAVGHWKIFTSRFSFIQVAKAS